MAKLVIQSAEQKGRAYELKVDKTTVGRVDDNTFQIADASVSSHHCEILLRGTEVIIRDLNSTNGTFINEEKISESVLKPGQKLRLGQIELSLESADAPATTTTAPMPGAPAPMAGAPKKQVDQTVVMKRGVSLNELEQGTRTAGFDTATKGFSKKTNKTNRWFLIGGIIVVVIVAIVFVVIFSTVGSHR
jgi:predicted component of type VI protein secretion system